MKHLFPLLLIIAILTGAYYLEPTITNLIKTKGAFKVVMAINLISYAFSFLLYYLYKVGAKIDKRMGNFTFLESDFYF